MVKLTYNERSLAIDLISWINSWTSKRHATVKRAGGEGTLPDGKKSLFPDVVLYGDEKDGMILQGWELKMPDTDIDDAELLENAKKKAKLLEMDSFLVWNVTIARLYKLTASGKIEIIKTWDTLSFIQKREDVEPNKSKIEEFLFEMLGELVSFFEKGVISSTRFVDVISGELLASFLNNNLKVYAEVLEEQSGKDSVFRDDVNLWWRYQKSSFEKEASMWEVLARNNLTALLNRFIFVHILKTYNKKAYLVEEIKEKVTVLEALNIFEQISKKCDFWNIFSKQLGEEVIPDIVWSNYVSLNKFLVDSRLDSLDSGFYHEILEKTINRRNRRTAGQFVTPYPLAKLLSNLTVDNFSGNVLDPCCGTGTILKAVCDLKKKVKIPSKDILDSLWASDKFSFPLHMATLSLIEPKDMGVLLKIFSSDVVDLNSGMEVEFRDPNNGAIIQHSLPKFDYILSNLPYVQQEDLKTLNPDIQNINARLGVEEDGGLDSKSDLYAYIPFYLWSLLKDGSRLGIIISNSWLGTKWGDVFRGHIQRFFDIEYVVVSGAGRWFKEAKVVGNILVLRKKSEISDKTDMSIKFVALRKDLDWIEENNKYSEITSVVRKMDSVDDEDVSVKGYSNEDLKELEKFGLKWGALFSSCDWLFEIEDKLIKASSLFEINRGERRGWDPMFYPTQPNAIEGKFLVPVLKNTSNIKSLIAKPDAQAFCCSDSEEELKKEGFGGALKWINKFKTGVNEKGKPLVEVLKRSSIYWYTMLPDTMADIVTSINFGDRLFFAKLEEKAFVNQRLIRFTAKDRVDVNVCLALLNSTLGLFYLEALGFGRGEGALDLNSDKLKSSLRIFNPDLLDDSAKQRVKDAFAPLMKRRILPLVDELNSKDRIEFEKQLFKEYGLSFALFEAIKKSLLTAYKIRVSAVG